MIKKIQKIIYYYWTYHDLIHIGSSIFENNLKDIKLLKIVEFSDESNKKEIKKSFEKIKTANYKINNFNKKKYKR